MRSPAQRATGFAATRGAGRGGVGMSRLTRIKVALAVIGLVLFGAGVRLEDSRLRWAGIGAVAVAWALRFVHSRAPGEAAGRES